MLRKLLLAAALAASAATLAACGGDGDTARPEAGGNPTDRAFVAKMIPHHESAVEMAEIAQERGKSPFVKGLADDIVRTQNAEISVMRREDDGLETAGVEVGSLGVPEHMTGMDGDLAMLRSAQDFDREFMEMMIPHHQGAIEMARAQLAKGADPELRKIAQDVVAAQEREIGEMREQLGDASS